MEAMSCGVPVVAANVSSLPEAVDNEVGRLCEPDKVDCFVEAIEEISSNKEHLLLMSRNSRNRALRKFCIDRMLSEYVDEFENVITKRKQL